MNSSYHKFELRAEYPAYEIAYTVQGQTRLFLQYSSARLTRVINDESAFCATIRARRIVLKEGDA